MQGKQPHFLKACCKIENLIYIYIIIIKTFRKEYYYDVVKVKKYKLLRRSCSEYSLPRIPSHALNLY